MKRIWALFLPVIGLTVACQEEIPTRVTETTPVIVAWQAPAAVYQFPARAEGVHVRVEDPQGPEDIAGVSLSVSTIAGALMRTHEMWDDGTGGDILAGDGQYFLPLDTALVRQQTGTFVLEAVARDQSGNRSQAWRDTLLVLPGLENRLPAITSVIVPAVVWTDSNYTVSLAVTAEDPDGVASLRHALVNLYPPAYPNPAWSDTLRDDGRSGDGAAGDGTFGLQLAPQQWGDKCGFHQLTFLAVDGTGGRSRAAVAQVRVTRLHLLENTPPRLSDLRAPATISRSVTPNTYVLSVVATDPDKICDDAVTRVFFNSFLPNGNAATGNPFEMRDDGNAGDAVAGDDRYSLTIQITPQNATGAYRFEFQAQDRNGALSDKLIHTITVTP